MAESPDSHDLDKLNKWHQGLISEAGTRFPICAVFLVSGEDGRAHGIFRVYRTAFEEMEAGFHDLVIFGQHGLSSSCIGLVLGLGLSGLKYPSLALIARPSGFDSGPPVCHTANLPAGVLPMGEAEASGKDIPWQNALEKIRRAVEDRTSLSLDGVKDLERRDFPAGPLAETVARVKQQVERA